MLLRIIHERDRRCCADDLRAGTELDPPGEAYIMSRWTKVALVCAGYLLAMVAGVIASRIYNARVSALPYDTSGGMYACGELLYVVEGPIGGRTAAPSMP